jgi:hypothetical protein
MVAIFMYTFFLIFIIFMISYEYKIACRDLDV